MYFSCLKSKRRTIPAINKKERKSVKLNVFI